MASAQSEKENSLWIIFRQYALGSQGPFKDKARRRDCFRLLFAPFLIFLFTVTVRPFDIPQETASLSNVTIDRIRAPFYKSPNEDASLVVLIDDAKLLQAGLRWPLPAKDWNRFLVQFHFTQPSAVFLDLMLTELREFPDIITEPPDGSLPSEKYQRCRPCEGGSKNPIASLSCFFEPAFTTDVAEAEAKEAARNQVCPGQVTTFAPTPLVAAGANPRIATLAAWSQNLPRCRPPSGPEVDNAEALTAPTSPPLSAENTVLECLAPASTVAPIQWRAEPGRYPLVIQTAPVDIGEGSTGPAHYEPSVAFSLLVTYCRWLEGRWTIDETLASEGAYVTVPRVVPVERPKGCLDLDSGALTFGALEADAAIGGSTHLLDLDWKSEAPIGNYQRGITGCSDEPRLGRSKTWQAVELFFSAIFANISGRSADRPIGWRKHARPSTQSWRTCVPGRL